MNIRKEMAKETRQDTPLTIYSFPHLPKERAAEMVELHNGYATARLNGFKGSIRDYEASTQENAQ